MVPVTFRVLQLQRRDRAAFQERVAALEQLATYPLGEDSFQIDHGEDYFAFFDRMGATHFFVALEGERVAAAGCGILRRVPFTQGGKPRRTWYACDLKVHPEYRGQRVPLRILRSAFCPRYLQAPRGYGISMNPGDGSPNRVVRLAKHWRWSPMRLAGTLGIYSLDAEAMAEVTPLLSEALGPVSYFSPRGIKDIVLQSTGEPMALLHAQYGEGLKAAAQEPQPDHVHMICLMEEDPLAQTLARRGVRPGASASVIAHGMQRCDWRFVLTSEI